MIVHPRPITSSWQRLHCQRALPFQNSVYSHTHTHMLAMSCTSDKWCNVPCFSRTALLFLKKNKNTMLPPGQRARWDQRVWHWPRTPWPLGFGGRQADDGRGAAAASRAMHKDYQRRVWRGCNVHDQCQADCKVRGWARGEGAAIILPTSH